MNDLGIIACNPGDVIWTMGDVGSIWMAGIGCPVALCFDGFASAHPEIAGIRV